MLTPQAELEMLKDHFQTRFTAKLVADQAITHRQWSRANGPLLEPQALCEALLAVPRRKAVPTGHPPSVSWRACADLIDSPLAL